jgi:hypothetical protein
MAGSPVDSIWEIRGRSNVGDQEQQSVLQPIVQRMRGPAG